MSAVFALAAIAIAIAAIVLLHTSNATGSGSAAQCADAEFEACGPEKKCCKGYTCQNGLCETSCHTQDSLCGNIEHSWYGVCCAGLECRNNVCQ